MIMTDLVFAISGDKKKTLLADADSFKFSNKRYYTVTEFEEGWSKKLSLDTKAEVKYDKLSAIVKEDTSREVHIKYKGPVGIKASHPFSFIDDNDYGKFFEFLEKRLYMSKVEEPLSPFKAISGHLFAFILILGFTIFFHYQAIDLEHGAAITGSGKTKAVLVLVRALGVKGVWLAGGTLAAFVGYKIYKRYTNPPVQTSFIPANPL